MIELLNNFAAINWHQAQTRGNKPPDPTIAVSARWVLVAVNGMIRAYDRANAYAIAGEKQLADFIETGGEPFDPRITYDHYSQRFLITALGAGLNLLASPKSPQKVEFLNSFKVAGPNEFGDPTKWHRANTPAFFTPPCGGPHFADQPDVGYAPDMWYVGAPMTGGDFETPQDIGLFFFQRFEDADEPLPKFQKFHLSDFGVRSCVPGMIDGINNRGLQMPRPIRPLDPPPAYLFVGVAADVSGPCDAGEFNRLRIYSVRQPFAQVPRLDFAEVETPLCFVGMRDETFGVPTSSGLTRLTLDARVTRAIFRATGKGGEIFVCHQTRVTENRLIYNIVRWYRIDLAGWPLNPDAAPVIPQGEHGVFLVPPLDRNTPVYLHLPSMAVTPDGGSAFMMERSSRQETQSLQIAGGMPPGPLQTAIASPSNSVVNGTDRWGDYTDLAYDFSDGTMWAIGEYQVHSLLPGIPMGPQKIAPLAGWWSTFVVNFKLVK